MARCLVRGLGDIGSAVAHALFSAGHAVALQDGPAPIFHRRRMSFVDVAFDSVDMLAGIAGRKAESVDALRTMLETRRAIPVWTGGFEDAQQAVAWDVLVDARMRKREIAENQRGLATLTIGLGPGFVAGETVDVVIETGFDDLGGIIHQGPAAPLKGEPPEIMGHGRDRMVYAPVAGRIRGLRSIGDIVKQGDIVAVIEGAELKAPVAGLISGMTRSGVMISAGAEVIEIDPRGAAAVFEGLGDRPRKIAEGVTRAVSEAGLK
jgi:xanthine dehydrogenase accessory factor